ncbi:hemophore-related protein [Mycolicibacterium iranicum]|uniref:Hemophore-related protein n=1 Tax=Mycolicibacterium iranicum TaxID=912594 RepID=A0A839Q9V6_MYCIR|nr:heme-binding protein [Mycolicibacterium iranicum]MBB2991235.1 hemophore-related protein [Mycolicibacterium iranicum]
MLAATLGIGGALVTAAVTASAQPAPQCTAADLAGVATGVSAATSAYLFTHPPVNDFFSTLFTKTPEEKEAAVTQFMDANPQVAAELRGIRQPLVDFRQRCHHLQP